MAKQSQIGNWGTRRLYDAVIQDYEGIGTIDEFHTNLESDENKRAFYDNLLKDGYDMGEYEEFVNSVKADDTVVEIKDGEKVPYVHPAHGEGYFDFSVEPEEGGTPGKRYAFMGKDGNRHNLQLESKFQGGRWEDAEHAKDDWERYEDMESEERRRYIDEMWQGSDVAGKASNKICLMI